MTAGFHEPVMVDEVIEFLNPGPGHVIVDGTLGGGGHADALLSWSGPGDARIGLLIGLDQDPEALARAGERLAGHGGRARILRGSFEMLPELLDGEGMKTVDGILLDLGVSRHQLTAPGRGFSLMADGPLDMRMDPSVKVSAGELLMRLEEKELADLIFEWGEERFARRIARAVVSRRQEGRPVETTGELKSLVESVAPRGRGEKIHPATRTFMALRIAVNRELPKLEQVLKEIPELLAPNGRAVVISYHSLEDRLVKTAFVREAKDCICPSEQPVCNCSVTPRLKVLTRRPVTPGAEEVERNPAARSAKLRAALRLES